MRAKILGAGLLAILLSSTALADTSSMSATTTGMGVLENEWVKAGVNGTTGTLGSGGRTSPGLLFDPTGTGTFNPGYDYLTPGSPFDGFSVKVDGTNYANNNTGAATITNDGNGLTDGTHTLSWTGGVSGVFDITNTYSLAPNTPYIDITSIITMGVSATTLSFAKYIDPDSQGMPGDSSSTDNVLGYGIIPSTNVAFSEATTSRYALGIYTTDTNVTAGVESWTQEADGYSGTNYTDSDGNPVNFGNSDDTIGISWTWTGISVGDILTASYAYIFGPSAFAAADSAITGGAGGGADVSSWGTLTDVGSATDAASGGGAPAPVITTETIVDTSRPVLTATITHHDSSVAAGVQTIDRELTTTTTTPMRTVTYTDGVETGSVVATSTVSSAVTDPGSFVGRMDQADAMLDLNLAHNLGFANGVTSGRTSHSIDNGYSAETTAYSLGHIVATDDGIVITGGINFANTTMTSIDGSGEMSTTHFGARVGRDLDGRDITVGLEGHVANSDLSYSRSIGDFEAAGQTGQSDRWATFTVEKSSGAIRPWAGYTIGKRSTDAWTETGDIQAVIDHPANEASYAYGTVGLNIEAGIVDLSFSKAFDKADTTQIGLGIDRQINDTILLGLSANRSITETSQSNYLSAGVKIKF